MSRALYRKYRPNSLDGIVGQQHVTDILARSLKQGKIAHAYLLTGPRGVGKTSIARILAHEINQLPYSDESTHLDIIEIDAASNNGVDDVRDLREKVNLAPVSAAKKVYIIDEVHMLSKAAFNALLKTLEEPPEHVIFILATTDVDKLPATIISRTQRFSFRAIGREDAAKLLRDIADKEKITIDDASLAIIAERGDGSFRDSISLLDQLSSLADEKAGITSDLVETTLGLAPRKSIESLLAAVKSHDADALIKLLDEFDKSGIQAAVLTSQLIMTIRSELSENPQLIGLLDSLLDVTKSSHPNIKLLTVLVNFATPKAKTAALKAPVAVISKPIEELEKPNKITSNQSRGSQLTSSNGTKSEEQPKTFPVVEPEKVMARNGTLEERKMETEQKTVEPKPKPKKTVPIGDLDWNKLIEHVRKHHIAIYSVLSKCGYEQDGATIKIYTGSAFYKKKLDDAKYSQQLFDSIIATGAGELIVQTIPTPPPPKDKKAAAIAALMGGGEEVAI
jgi:DNA polymerase-3 subunit gamma/tau